VAEKARSTCRPSDRIIVTTSAERAR
jgi:hypothetical protein